MQQSQRTVHFDDYARKAGTTPSAPGQSATTGGFTRPGNNNGAGVACEWDRLMREREELLESGTYTADDPLILEIDRQIKAS